MAAAGHIAAKGGRKNAALRSASTNTQRLRRTITGSARARLTSEHSAANTCSPRACTVTQTVTSTDDDSESAAPARSTARVDREVEVRRAAGEGRALEIVDHTSSGEQRRIFLIFLRSRFFEIAA